MRRLSPSALSSQANPPGSARRALLPAALLASLLGHWLALTWANGTLALPELRTETAVVMTELHPVPAAPAAPPARPTVKPKRSPSARPAAPRPAPAAAPTETPAASGEAASEAPATAQAEASPPSEDTAPQASEPSGTVKFGLPPPAQLKYEVQAQREGKHWFGGGAFQWETNGAGYVITGEASVDILFKITVLNFRSEGAVGASGIAPVLYSEKPWRKPTTNTHFQHDSGKISFSASQAVYPYTGSEQDRASIMWQLAGIGRGDPTQFAPGAAFDILVAGARNTDTWRIDVIGLEEIDTRLGKMSAWHVARVPKPGSYDQRIDIWLTPQHEWYPARLRYTYANGDYLDMLLTELTPHAPVAPVSAAAPTASVPGNQ